MPLLTLKKLPVYSMLLLGLLIAGCGSKEVLARKSPVAPAESALAGRWTMIEDIDLMQREVDRAIRQTSGAKQRQPQPDTTSQRTGSRPSAGQRPRRRSGGGLVYVFLENGQSLKITQTETGLFIDFNRSVVEEYRFGEAQMISKGEVQAQRVSGWENDDYVVETLDGDQMKLTERYKLESDNRLQREITLRSKKDQSVTIIQHFNRNVES